MNDNHLPPTKPLTPSNWLPYKVQHTPHLSILKLPNISFLNQLQPHCSTFYHHQMACYQPTFWGVTWNNPSCSVLPSHNGSMLHLLCHWGGWFSKCQAPLVLALCTVSCCIETQTCTTHVYPCKMTFYGQIHESKTSSTQPSLQGELHPQTIQASTRQPTVL